MRYTLFVHEAPDEMSRRDGDDAPAYWAAWQAYTAALEAAGVLVGGNVLAAARAATTVSGTGGSRTIHDGPFADSHESLGGYYVSDVGSLDEALIWADRCPATARGRVELWPVLDMS